jgi:hypothetical protein
VSHLVLRPRVGFNVLITYSLLRCYAFPARALPLGVMLTGSEHRGMGNGGRRETQGKMCRGDLACRALRSQAAPAGAAPPPAHLAPLPAAAGPLAPSLLPQDLSGSRNLRL